MGEGEEQNEELKGKGGQDELQILNCILDWTNKYSRKHGSAHKAHSFMPSAECFYMPTVYITGMLLEEKVFRPLSTRTNLATPAGV